MARIRIESIAAGGDGVGRTEGLVVFVPRTAPGELVEARTAQRGRLARGRLLRVLEPAAERVPPRCRHYDGDRCGGCQLQHLSIEAQRAAKQRIVRDAFARIAKRDIELPEIVPSAADWEYRSRLTLTMRRSGEAWNMGLHSFDDVNQVFDLMECPITDPRVVAAWQDVRTASEFLPRASELRGIVRLTGGDLALTLEGGVSWPRSREFVARTPVFSVIRWRPDRGGDRVIADRGTTGHPAESFDQVNQPVAVAARNELVQRALAGSPQTAIDAYAGLGQSAKLLAAQGVTVTAIEADVAAAQFAGTQLPSTARVLAARVEDVIAQVLPADVVILNPPRTGVDARVTTALEAVPPRQLLYMSCDAATLARDVARLAAYRVISVRAYDMFPQTAHVEVVCALVPEGA